MVDSEMEFLLYISQVILSIPNAEATQIYRHAKDAGQTPFQMLIRSTTVTLSDSPSTERDEIERCSRCTPQQDVSPDKSPCKKRSRLCSRRSGCLCQASRCRRSV
jgi:hypothetical protein